MNVAIIENFLKLKTDQLRAYLRNRGVPVAGEKHQELAEKAFLANKLSLPEKKSDKEAEFSIIKSKADKLILDHGMVQLPRPETLSSGWEFSPSSLPNCARSNIDNYVRTAGRKIGLQSTEGVKTLGLGKGLHLSSHVKDMAFNGISPNISYCYVRAKVIPQTKTNEEPYFTWVVLNKDNGQIVTGECNCIVGIQASCKHVAAVLFTIVEAVEQGRNLSTTSQKMAWGRAAATVSKHATNSKFLEDIKFVQVKADTSIQDLGQSTKCYRSSYDPRALVNRVPRSLSDFDLDKLATITNGKTGLLMYFTRASDPSKQYPDLNEITTDVEIVTTHEALTVREALLKATIKSPTEIISTLKVDGHQQSSLAATTTGQASCAKWHEHREARLTASVAADCAAMVVNDPPQLKAGHSCIAKVLGYYGHPESPALQWGKNMEVIARKQYVAHHKLVHKHPCTCKETGLWVSLKYPYVAGSPDGVIICSTCESGRPGLLEIKNPYTHRTVSINELATKKDSSGLIIENTKIHLNRKHKYFTQIQVQLHSTGFSWCDFVVRTISPTDNFHVERVYRDDKFLDSLFPKLEFFFSNAIIPELLNPKVKDIVIGNAVRGLLNELLDKVEKKLTPSRQSIPYPCGICGNNCEENPVDSQDRSIGCDECQLWYHFRCIGLTGSESFLKKRKSKWSCNECKKKASRKRRKTEP